MSAEIFKRLAAPIFAGDLTLVPLRSDHAEALARAFDDDELWTWMLARKPCGPADVRAWIEDALARTACGDHVPFVIERRDGSLGGTTRFLEIRPHDGGLEIGWTMLFASARGTALNSLVKIGMLDRAFETGFARVQLKTDARNLRSRAAILAIGGTYEGTLRAYQRRADGTLRDTAVYSVLAQEWPNVRERLVRRAHRRSGSYSPHSS